MYVRQEVLVQIATYDRRKRRKVMNMKPDIPRVYGGHVHNNNYLWEFSLGWGLLTVRLLTTGTSGSLDSSPSSPTHTAQLVNSVHSHLNKGELSVCKDLTLSAGRRLLIEVALSRGQRWWERGKGLVLYLVIVRHTKQTVFWWIIHHAWTLDRKHTISSTRSIT